MEIVQTRSALLSNYEVFSLLKEQENERKQQVQHKHPENLLTIEFEVVQFLEGTPSGTQTPEQLADFLESIKDFGLTKAEKLQILNLRPRSAVEIHLLIEECEERFSQERLEELINLVAEKLPRDDDEEVEADENSDQMEE
ncbi:calcitonin gene-related peptide-receptor component protein-like protein [Basidiobolus meristosporus CBS 931.73]|uniref:DNA-directed RNA polymerase III subunit RPC9 n=1 Tax=Basidiobolus meristosporus CBS 931.73 TaxID=1314790 RepID=A0A1Y1XXH4_9FUNG|nr:calcitonin gene-related peptide-receptor component protein-like protein [Basidiobolus meristosporus CBS 931.73]|eukprot:ORX90441.1 calcitonin gene-related peptide-receptor component protein-like protein [Basidiobolus meristosporus CBS 931.73]